jgi:hypothetical protein
MRSAFVLTTFLALQATSVAQTQSPLPVCNGDITVVRVSHIKPGGSIEKFLAAAAAHQAWYRANGITDNEIVTARVLVRDPATGAVSYSDTEVLSYHIRLPQQRLPNRGDAAWNAYVKQYQETSEIKSEYMTCMPKLTR